MKKLKGIILFTLFSTIILFGTVSCDGTSSPTSTNTETSDKLESGDKAESNDSGNETNKNDGEANSNNGETHPSEETSELSENASVNAKKLYNFIWDNYGKKVISGQMDLTWDSSVDMAARVYNDTEKYPALMGYDFMNYTSLGWADNSTQTEEAIAWAKGTYKYNSNYTGHKGGIVTFNWHWRDPLWEYVESGVGEFSTDKTSFRIPYKNGSLDETTNEFKAIKEDLDVIAGELKKLKDEGIPVLWRPLHEGAGNRYAGNGTGDWEVAWFWWGAGTDTGNKTNCAEAYIALWKYMHDYFTNTKGLDNLIWVWNGQAAQFYPGNDYVDIIGWDVYGQWDKENTTYTVTDEKWNNSYKTLDDLESGKPIALSEIGTIPNKDLTRWAYFMVWNDGNNETENFWSNPKMNPNKISVYQNPDVITLENIPDWATYEY